MAGDLLLDVKAQEILGLQKNQVLFSKLLAFDTLLNNVYETSCPSPEDYANRRDMVRIFNEIAKEMYGYHGNCPTVESFGSFLMDMFNARSDLDLSINFSDKVFEADRRTKIKTLRKFANKFYKLQKAGHITTVELILSARVPVLKVTDRGSGIDCDFSVGNRDGIAKSHIVRLISAIDERFRKLSFMIKAWAKAHDINSSKDGTLNSISLILLAAFHLQTRDVPILPPFSAIFKDGMDLVAVEKIIPSFYNYGESNRESLAELFVSLLVKLESVKTYWKRGLCASTYEGSWKFVNWKAAGAIRIEDFTDRSENTARAVKPAKLNKIYSCICRSLKLIQSFTKGNIDAAQLKDQLFCGVEPRQKNAIGSINYSKVAKKKKKKRFALEDTAEGEGKQEEDISFLTESASPSVTGRVKKLKQGKLEETRTQKSRLVEGKQGEHVPLSTKSVSFSATGRVKKVIKAIKLQKVKKNKLPGRKMHPEASNSVILTSLQGLDKSRGIHTEKSCPQGFGEFTPNIADVKTKTNAAPTFQVGQPSSILLNQGSGEYRPRISNAGNSSHVASSFPVNQQYSLANPPIEQRRGVGPQRISQPLSFSNQHFQDSGGYRSELTHVEKSRYAAQICPPFPPVSGYGGFRPDLTHAEKSRHAAQNYPPFQPPASGYGGLRLERAHVETFNHAASSFPSNQSLRYTEHLHSQGCGGFRSVKAHVETSRYTPPKLPVDPPYSHSNPLTRGFGGFIPERTHAARPSYSSLNSQPAGFRAETHHTEINYHATPMFQSPRLYSLSSRPESITPHHQAYPPTVSHRNPTESERSQDCRQSIFPYAPSPFAANLHPYQR
ncbi:uncharacterized protein LOC130802780 isoform X2 [Amaranthus tricolor]|uniref:uncharacterized protein LOC130802780 isoform X2 n=1 Tax=Amaranthus tricolor TaxID=29722 RepID=UPI002590AA2B|nr:uncharacterized protein LOC130802780 isoform X2 [Amaranthus tricolor]XP_057522833.1 uncharacterized protein LOC130802780 isoform X2 [Amaranthus tricolor]